MPYSTWDKLKMPLDLDGSMVLFNNLGFASAFNIASPSDMAQLQGESPAKNATTSIVSTTAGVYVVVLFPELRDISAFLARIAPGGGAPSIVSVAWSADTTNGLDGTWTAVTTTGAGIVTNNSDWWRANAPVVPSSAISGAKGFRFSFVSSQGSSNTLHGLHLFGKKTSGQTPDDILFLNSDGSTESTVDFDYGDFAAGGGTSDATIYVKNPSTSKVANNVVLSLTGSNPTDLTISVDGGANFFATRTLTELLPGTTQQVIVRLTSPTVASGNATPRAANLRAAVGTWRYYVGKASETDTGRPITRG